MRRLSGLSGFVVYSLLMVAAIICLPPLQHVPAQQQAFFTIGALAMWRYGWGLINLTRSIIYNRVVFPRWRARVAASGDDWMPPHIFCLVTAYRIEPDITARIMAATIREAIDCKIPTTIIASIVEACDEALFRQVFESLSPPERVRMHFVRIPGTGKRDGLAHGFRAIARALPPPGSVVAVIDGDSMITPGLIRRCVPFFRLRPDLGALTTDEYCRMDDNPLMHDWHDMRFAQRHIQMSSIALSRRVMTLTGRMSMFRADIVTDPAFIHHMLNDHLDHWRLGRFKFLTGDDKSSLYWVMKSGYEQLYIPDTHIITLEPPAQGNFVQFSTRLMIRWFGNMLRTNMRILKLGPRRMPFFVWWSFLDQRISMWTTLSGPVFAVMLSSLWGWMILVYYIVWVGFTRWIAALTLLSARNHLSWRYPFLLYYSQVYGSLIKTFVLFRLDRQSWTRQNTKLLRDMGAVQAIVMRLSSGILHGVAIIMLVVAIGLTSGALGFHF